jgi:hypothetical protein
MARPVLSEKTCKGCLLFLPRSAYRKAGRSPAGVELVRSVCLACEAAGKRQHRHKDENSRVARRKICETCGKELTGKQAYFCTRYCRNKAGYARKREEQREWRAWDKELRDMTRRVVKALANKQTSMTKAGA